MIRKNLIILGSTGSIGNQVLDIVRQNEDKFNVLGISNFSNNKVFTEQIDEFSPKYISSPSEINEFKGENLKLDEIVSVEEVDLVVNGIVGSAGLLPTVKALENGTNIALANKEPIVMAGHIIVELSNKYNGKILPIDSEPSAIWQCLEGEDTKHNRIFITASGGAFRGRKWEELNLVKPKEALKHPTWKMGDKITIDSATLMNKAFEVIETKWLFDSDFDSIEVLIHPQSVIHSMVEFIDGSIKAQLGNPDMRHPISYALSYPKRLKNEFLDWFDPVKYKELTFNSYNLGDYPCFDLAMEYAKKGGSYNSVLTGADESAINAFIEGKIKFTEIHELIKNSLENHVPIENPNLDEIIRSLNYGKNSVLENL